MKSDILNEQIQYPAEQSFVARYREIPHFSFPWHFHNEYEIIFIEQSEGKRFTGDHLETFGAGTLNIMGPNLPHCYINNKEYYKSQSGLTAKAYIIQFKSDYFSDRMLDLPEFMQIKKILNASKRGISFNNIDKKEWIPRFKKLITLKGLHKYIELINILNDLGSMEYHILASEGFVNINPWPENKRLGTIYQFVLNNYRNPISVTEVAKHAAMNPTSFCRFFKSQTQKTFNEFIQELRIGYASKLLLNGESNIAKVGFESGFNNLSNFNRQFKKITMLTPTQYIEQHNPNQKKEGT